jgi:hypothetical protein
VKESVRVKKPRRVDRNGMGKYRKHSVRLLLNRDVGLEYGRFDPTLSEREKNFILKVAALEDMQFATYIYSRLDF